MDDLYIGLMSGTSLDGIDACLVDLSDNEFKLIATKYYPYPDETRKQIAKIIADKTLVLSNLSSLDQQLGILNSDVVNQLLAETETSHALIAAIGYHGQTVYHQPSGKYPNTIQLGNPNTMAKQTGITTVSDFRRMDMAEGGQGAPLAPAFHRFLFQTEKQDRAILNLGGIANLTILPADINKPIYGFDTGPANCLLDEWYALHNQGSYDRGGIWAEQGQLNQDLLDQLLADPYFSQAIPKSTGREYFHLAWLEKGNNLKKIEANDVQATLAHLTATSVSRALQKQAPETKQVFVCGGGVHNLFLISLLKAELGDVHLASTSELGLDPDWVEACAFAWLAQQRLQNIPANIPSVTGARERVLLGAIYEYLN